MFVLTTALGFAFPEVENGWGRVGLALIAVLFFLPPGLVLDQAKAAGHRFHVRLVGFLALGSLLLTVVLLALTLISFIWSDALANALYAALVIVSSPMICSNLYAISLFLWGTLLAGAFFSK
jgi:hypothetical protein